MENDSNVVVATRRLWFPCYSQLIITSPNRSSYLYSLWVGLTAPFLNLPRLLWVLVILPVLLGILMMTVGTVTAVIAGVAGCIAGVDVVKLDDMKDASGA